MSRSLQRHLSKMLALVVLASGVLASVVAFYFAYTEAQEFQDDALRQVAALSAGARSDIRQLDAASKAVEDPESRIQLIRLPDGPRPVWLTSLIAPGFHTLVTPAGQSAMRVFVRDLGEAGRLVVAQSTESRNEIAFNSALRTLIPLLILLPILIGLLAFIVRGEFRSLRRLSENLDRQTAERPMALPEVDLPDEITPFVQAINRLLERVDRMIGEQRRFIADAAHELRTPLTALSLQAQNVSQAESAEIMRERLLPLQAGIERARKMTVQLLDFAQTQARTPRTDSSVDLSVMTRSVIAEFFPLAEAKDIDLGLEESAKLHLRCDPQTLQLILRNALENALKYTPQGGVVTIKTAQEGENAIIEIIDTGPGIPSSEHEQVFKAFYRQPNSAVEEGSGLGLAIAREAANRLGGRISLSDREGGSGLIFRYSQVI